ncbi:MAG TPA: CU044_2847 family protein [Ktedonobacteraceae bacterium]|jgi:hypothetical protein
MSSRLIQLQDGIFVEAEAPDEQAQQLSGSFADKVNANIDKIKPILTSVARPIVASWHELNQHLRVEQAEVELGLSFEYEGNLYITRSSASANITIKLILKPTSNQTSSTP